MRALRAALTGILTGALGCSLNVAVLRAAPYPVSGLNFECGPLPFAVGPIVMPAEMLNFPGGPVQTETAGAIEVTLPADILFDFDKSEIRRDAANPLHELAELLRARARGPVVIQGYTDAIGSDTYNQTLSERRAAAVKTWLVMHEGLRSVPFTTTGFGSRSPVAPNRKPDGSDNPEGRQSNRRVTFIIRK